MHIPWLLQRLIAVFRGGERSRIKPPVEPVATAANREPPQLLGLDLDPKFEDIYEAGMPDAYRARLASMRPFVLEVFLRTTVDKQPVAQIAFELGLSQRTARRLLREAVRIVATPEE